MRRESIRFIAACLTATLTCATGGDQIGAAQRPEPSFLWIDSGKLGGRIDLHGTPIHRKAVIFYAQHIGLYPYYWQGKKVNGGAPQVVNLNAHLAKTRKDIHKKIPDPNWDGFAILDFEPWFAGWEWCQPEIREQSKDIVRQRNPEFDDDQVERWAIAEYERVAEHFLLETLRVCHEERPRTKWGFYGVPYGEPISETAARVFAHADAVFPSAYMGNRGVDRGVEPGPGEVFHDWNRASITGRVRRAREAAGDKPVMTLVWLLYHNLNETYAGQLLQQQDLELMLRAPIEASADGLIFWGHIEEPEMLLRQQADLQRRVGPILEQILEQPSQHPDP